ncbi:hypothetical protein [Polynucleobacter sp.]|uniref:hypothetical protein n=1 Tax=Polynucleobacter sp. TaxID=2029855 RepID=UPI003F6A38D4
MELLNPKITLQNASGNILLATLEHDFGNGELINCTVKLNSENICNKQVSELENQILLEIGNRIRMLMK